MVIMTEAVEVVKVVVGTVEMMEVVAPVVMTVVVEGEMVIPSLAPKWTQASDSHFWPT